MSGSLTPSNGTRSVRDNAVLLGTLCSGLSALGYSAANVFLRRLVDTDPVLVATIKTIPTILMTLPWLWLRYRAGQEETIDRRSLWILLAVAVFGHLAGNVGFQLSLGVVGLVVAVPIVFGAMLISSPILSRWLLAEKVSQRTMLAMTVLIIAIMILALNAKQISNGSDLTPASSASLLGAILLLCLAGIAYTLLGIGISYGLKQGMSLPACLFIVSSSGFVVLMAVAMLSVGWAGMLATESQPWLDMLLAGIFNAVAFLALTRALQLTTVTHVNLINASQVTLAAVTGVWLFNETPTVALAVGIVITVIGLVMIQAPEE
jgi:drug/metabolite transporter (DMT)-like permease